MKTNARASRDQALLLEPGRDGRGRVAVLDDELDLLGVGRDRLGQGRAEVLADDVGDEWQPSAAGLSAAQARIALLTRGRSAVSATTRTSPARTQREHQELDEPDDPAPAAPAPSPAVAAVAVTARRLERLGHVVGRVGVGLVPAGVRLGRWSRGRPPERMVMGASPSSGWCCGRPGRAAAVELILQDDRGRLPVDARTIGVALVA